MKVCVPSLGKRGLEERVGEHFGRVPFYTIYDTETGKVEVIENTSQHMGGTGYPAEIISRKGVEVMLCKGIGRRAIQMFEEFGVMVFVGAKGGVKETIEMWEKGELEAATDEKACKEHKFGHHHHS